MPKLERSLKLLAKDFGETSAQAVVRWGVQSCREAAFEALPFGTKAKLNKDVHFRAISRDLGRVVFIDEKRARSKESRIVRTPLELGNWLDSNKRGYKNRTKKLPPEKRKICSQKTFDATVKLRMAKVGIAKGGFLGAGMDIAREQTGMGRVNIGKNFLGYAQKHSGFGSSTTPKPGFFPSAKLTNSAAHTSKDYVLKRNALDKAIKFGLSKTVNWYRRAISAIDTKRKP